MEVRQAVVETLGRLEPATLAQHSAALVAGLEDVDAVVRGMVVKTLGKLEPGTPGRAHLSAHQAMQSSLGNSLLTASACPGRAQLWAQLSAQQEALRQKLRALDPEQV